MKTVYYPLICILFFSWSGGKTNTDFTETETKDSIWRGSLHDPFRRDFDEFNNVGDQDSLRKTLKLENWNHFKIYCKGPDIKVWLNDILMATYTETDKSIATSGIIGLQLHDGPPTEVRFKNIMLREL